MKKLRKKLVLALMIPILLMPTMTKAFYQPDFSSIVTIPDQANLGDIIIIPGEDNSEDSPITLTDDLGIELPDVGIDRDIFISPDDSTDNTTDPTEEARHNYSVNLSNNVENGVFVFDNNENYLVSITVDEIDSSLSKIKSVNVQVKDSVGMIALEKELAKTSAGFLTGMINTESLSLDGTYSVILTITSEVETNTSPLSFSETTNALTLMGKNLVADDNSNDDTIKTVVENYYSTISPSPEYPNVNSVGIYTFNHTDKAVSNIYIAELDDNTNLSIEKVRITVRDKSNGDMLINLIKTETDSMGRFIFNLNLNSLDLNSEYVANAFITYMNSNINDYQTQNLALVEYHGAGESVVDNNDNTVVDNSDNSSTNDNTDNSSDNTTISVMTEDNYQASINKTTTTVSGLKVYYYRTSDDNLRISIDEKDNSSRITKVTYYILDITNNKTYTRVITENEGFELNFNFSGLNSNNDYRVDARITYVNNSDATDYLTKTYQILKLVPKEVTNNSSSSSSTSTSTSNGNSNSQLENSDNIVYDINKTLTSYNGRNLYLYNSNEALDIEVSQDLFGSNVARVESMTFLENGSTIKNCTNTNNCTLSYQTLLNTEVALSVRVNYAYDNYADNQVERYSKIYDLGNHLRISTTTNNDSDQNSPSAANDNILALNEFILIKGSSPSVYLLNKYNNRFYIPDWSVLKSWYQTPQIIQVEDAQLSQYTLKENVIYRPGSLIKIATDPKCYAVDLNGELRWVYNENVARAIYGSTWNKNIYIVPDALFPSYSFGEDIYDADDFDMPSLGAAAQMYNK